MPVNVRVAVRRKGKEFFGFGPISRTVFALCSAASIGLSGCGDDKTTKPSSELTHVRMVSASNLHNAPDGMLYVLWGLGIAIDSNSVDLFIDPLLQFQWDSENSRATDQDGAPSPVMTENGQDVGRELARYMSMIMTLEPLDDTLPSVVSMPVLLAGSQSIPTDSLVLRTLFDFLPFYGFPGTPAYFSLLSQSNKRGIPGARWRDGATEGYGIWFCEPRVVQSAVYDYNGGYQAYYYTIDPTSDDSYQYTVWISSSSPESSFSDFGRVFAGHQPDLRFLDGHPLHDSGMSGPGVSLGQEPVESNGIVIGYRYYSDDGSDTCVVRIDDPSLTRCSKDTVPSRQLDSVTFVPRLFSVTDGDTVVTSTLENLLDLTSRGVLEDQIPGNGSFYWGWQYEAWLVFTNESGLAPLSLGRFTSAVGFDRANPYTRTGSQFDSNFAFPGEDFLTGLPSGIGSPLNVITDPRVKKLWITIEPATEFDWALDAPFTQLIYLSQFIPKDLTESDQALRPLIHRDVNSGPNSLNEGNFFPEIRLQFLAAPME